MKPTLKPKPKPKPSLKVPVGATVTLTPKPGAPLAYRATVKSALQLRSRTQQPSPYTHIMDLSPAEAKVREAALAKRMVVYPTSWSKEEERQAEALWDNSPNRSSVPDWEQLGAVTKSVWVLRVREGRK